MIIQTTELDFEMLKSEVLKLIEEADSSLESVSESAVRTGLATLNQPLGINKILIERALETIYEQSRHERSLRQSLNWSCNEAMEEAEARNRIDQVDHEFILDQQIPF